MPVIIPECLPAKAVLTREHIFVMNRGRAETQDIRPLKVAIVNLMPTKIETETQLLRMLSNTPLQVEVDLVKTSSYESRNTGREHLKKFYTTFDAIKANYYDAMIVTGAPVERMEFAEVDYWDELKSILDFAEDHVYSAMFICWAAQAALYHYYGVPKVPLLKKLTGVFDYDVIKESPLTRGFDSSFSAPHSRYTTCREEDLKKVRDLVILANSRETGVHLAAAENHRKIFIFGHSEYDAGTLDQEYRRDLQKEAEPPLPRNYYVDNDPEKGTLVRWKAHGNLLFSNWLNYCVYQETPYEIGKIGELGKHSEKNS